MKGILKILVCILRIKKNILKNYKTINMAEIIYLFNEHNEEEDHTSNNDINAFKDAKKLLNDLRSNLSCEETKRIREKLYKKEAINNFLMENESLTNKEKKVLKNIDRYPKNISTHLKNFKKHFKKLQNINMA